MTKVPKEIYAEVERRFKCVKPWSEAYHELHSMQNFLWWLDEWLFPMEEIKEETLETKYKEAKRKWAIARAKAEQQIKDHNKAIVDVVEVKEWNDKEISDEIIKANPRDNMLMTWDAIDRISAQIEALTKAVLQLQSHVFNK